MRGAGAGLAQHFRSLEDPRAKHLADHKLVEIIVIDICGAETWIDVELFGNERLGWLRQFPELKHGVPSHDTFGRVFARLDPEQFQGMLCRMGAGGVPGDERSGRGGGREEGWILDVAMFDNISFAYNLESIR